MAGIDQDLNRQELLRALHAVSEKIGARIIGEGLDTLEELETLGRLGIPFGQGWLFGKPHPCARTPEAARSTGEVFDFPLRALRDSIWDRAPSFHSS